MNRIYTTLLCVFVTLQLSAQKKSLSIEDAVLKRNSALAPSRLPQLQWIPGTTDYSYVVKQNGTEYLMIHHTDDKPSDSSIQLYMVNQGLYLYDKKLDSLTAFPSITWLSKDRFRFFYQNKFFVYNKTYNNVINPYFTDFADLGNFDFAPITNNVASTRNDSLFITIYNETILNGNPKNVHIIIPNKFDGNVVGGSVHRNEFGINKGTYWSPKGNSLAFYDMDESMVTTYPIVSLEDQPSKAKMIRYPMAGDKSHHVKVKIYSVITKKIIELKVTGPLDQYLTNISWSPDEKYIYVAVLNREQNHMQLNEYSTEDGSFIKTLFEEKHEKYVEPLHGLNYLKNAPKPKEKSDLEDFVPPNPNFIYQSNRDGFSHLYLYSPEGTLLKQLTSGNYDVLDYLGDDKKGFIYFTATKESPIEKHIYSVNTKDGVITLLDTGAGVHIGLFSDDFQFFIDYYSNTTTPRIINLRNNKAKLLKTLHTSVNPLEAYAMPSIEMFTIKTKDGSTDLHCRVLKPSSMEAGKKYPVMVYVYGGPHAQMNLNQWLGGADLWMHAFAEQGYIVFTLDNRGSMNRGRDFEQATFRQLGTVEMEDQLMGVEWLKKQPYVDANRMAVHGWSFGGFMTTTLMSKSPNTFKVGVCGGPVIDWSMYEVMYTERYMDMPKENPEGYKKSNLLNYVDNLQGKLLMIHGTSDDVVLWEHSLKYIKACVQKGKMIDYFVYPEHLHNVMGKDRVHLINKVTSYIKDNLK